MTQNQIFTLAAVGIGAFLLMRKTQAGPVQTTQGGAIRTPSATQNGAVIGARSFNASPTVAQAPRAAQPNLAAGVFGAINGFFSQPSKGPPAIANSAQQGQIGWGWQYFTDGTTISPEGVYYKDGKTVWTPSAAADTFPVNYANAYASDAWAVDEMGNGIY